MPDAVISSLIAVHCAPPCTVEWFDTMWPLRQARTVITAMSAHITGTVYFSKAWIRPQWMLDWLLVHDGPADTRLFAFVVADLHYTRSLGLNLTSASGDDVLSDPEFAKWRQ